MSKNNFSVFSIGEKQKFVKGYNSLDDAANRAIKMHAGGEKVMIKSRKGKTIVEW